jgi:hypothetical protein
MAVQPLPPKGNDAVRFAFSHKSGKQDWCAHDIVGTVSPRSWLETRAAMSARRIGYFIS